MKELKTSNLRDFPRISSWRVLRTPSLRHAEGATSGVMRPEHFENRKFREILKLVGRSAATILNFYRWLGAGAAAAPD